MKIVNANMLEAKDDLLAMVLKTEPSQIKERVIEWLVLNLGTDLFGAWLAFEDDEIVGMLIIETVANDVAYLSFDWTKNGDIKGLLEKAERWAKDLGLRKMIKYTRRPDTYTKYGWSIFQTVLTKEL